MLKKASNYMDEIFSHVEYSGISTHYSYQLKLLHHKIDQGLRALSCIGVPLWNNLDKSLKGSTSLNAFKHKIRD